MIGRNDPCYCGSGKKYKQCCLSKQSESQAEQVKAQRFFERKYNLTKDLQFFLAQKHGGEYAFDQQKMAFLDASLTHLRHGIGNVWMSYFHKYENGMRGIEWFLEERGRKYGGEDLQMLEQWKRMKISCFQQVDLYEKGAIIEDIWSGERFRMPYCETMVKTPPWAVAIGMIEPYIEDWCIHGVFMWGLPDTKAEIMDYVQQQQELTATRDDQKLAPTDIIAANYPELMYRCNRIIEDSEKVIYDIRNTKKMKEYTAVTRKYTCTNSTLLVDLLLEREDEFILVPETDLAEEKIVISRMKKLDHIFGIIPAERRELLGLDEMHISINLGNIVINSDGVTAHGWWSEEFAATLELLETSMTLAVGLTRIDEQKESHQFPEELNLVEYNLFTEKELSEQEASEYSNLPNFLQWYRDEQEKHPEVDREMLIRKREYEQYLINPDISSYNLLRKALGLTESPFSNV